MYNYFTRTITCTDTARLLYISHSLSAWNSRLFEFGAYLFLADIFPHTLLPASVYALVRAGAAATFAACLGRYVDSGDRLQVVRVSIVGQRAAVALSCVTLLAMEHFPLLAQDKLHAAVLLSLLSILAAVEKLSSVLNTMAVERDWVVVVAEGDQDRLRALNSQMRRVDLFSKLLAPLAISFIDAASSQLAIIITGAMTALSIAIEYLAIARVHKAVPALHHPKAQPTSPHHTWSSTAANPFATTKTYFTHPAFLPSFALSLLYLNVLSFAGQMITYLLSLGLPSSTIGLLRGLAALSELSATYLAPKLMHRIGAIRSGIWFLNWEIACVAIATLFFWLDDDNPTITTAAGTVAAVIASRIGLWGFDLSAQIIVQEEVEAEQRGAFSSREMAFQNLFEMVAFASTVVWTRPEEFKVPASISAGAVGVAGVLYAVFVRGRRGHLLHMSRCVDPGRRGKGWRRVAQEEEEEEVAVEDGR
ncbi:putative Ferriportin iron efflux transporter [Teratosphaeria nubilosa]|uniref:Solute carrier family 40 member n=1 Tax=Teratosphaeria nubilosa TaxID=161662 RepID=A0A6G1LD80_9PEZI|nr:putative Ferriportin iron efflux transporter [Teratosphaeria nubilosa]